jgi:hypothetical protein
MGDSEAAGTCYKRLQITLVSYQQQLLAIQAAQRPPHVHGTMEHRTARDRWVHLDKTLVCKHTQG